MDLIVNVALFVALGVHLGWLAAVAGFVATTLVLSLDFNMERLYRVPRTPAPVGPPPQDLPLGAPEPAYRAFEALYRRVFAPQDRWIERLDRAMFARIEGRPWEQAPLDRRLAWSDLFSTATLVDLGLSTQTLLLAAALLVGWPGVYLALALIAPAWALGVQLLRLARYRAYRRLDERDDEEDAAS
jgi:hypothetical protein